MNLTPYPAYKDSGVAWLGEVPEHWEVRRLSNLVEIRLSNVDKHTKEDEIPVRLSNYVDVYKNDCIRPNMKFMQATATHDEILQFKLLVDDVIITKDSESWTDIAVPTLVRETASDLVCGYHLALLRSLKDQIAGSYLFRSLQAVNVQYQSHMQAKGVTRYGLSYIAIKSVRVPVPLPDEQTHIARFLDWKTAQINKFIKNKKRLIALLKEQKQVIINDVVTGKYAVKRVVGADGQERLEASSRPPQAMRPSGVDWLGDIPVEWEVRRIKTVSKILRGKFSHRPRNDASLYDGAFPFIQTGDVARAKKFITGYKQTLNEKGFSVSKQFPKGTLTMTIAANIGDVAILDFDACFPDSIVGFVPGKLVSLDFLYYVFTSMKQEFLKEAPVNTQGNLNVERIGSMSIPLPAYSIQLELLKYIEVLSDKIDHAITRAEREISLIKEYRTRLVSDVVTGKIDVRGIEVPEVMEDLEADPCNGLDEDLVECDDILIDG